MCATCGCGQPDAPAGGLRTRMVALERDVLGRNDQIAAQNRTIFALDRTTVVNLVSAPGSGKTALLCRTLRALRDELPLGVIEGDQQTSLDAERIRETGVAALQINTGRGCHLDAAQVAAALPALPDLRGGLLFIENVGNLVCPAGFDLGEDARVVVLSVTEGEDKPLKYPDIFASSKLLILNKSDLLPHLDFDLDRCVTYARRVNPAIEVLTLSARSGAGMDAWLDWLRRLSRSAAAAHPPASPAADRPPADPAG